MSESTQAKHLIRFTTSLGENALIPENIDGQQSMSDGFRFRMNLFSETLHELKTKDLVGTAATIGLVQADDSFRYFNGFISKFKALGTSSAGQKSHYQLTITSWLELFLSKRINCRIYQNKTVEQVIKDVFKDYGGNANFKLDLKKTHSEKRYWVQYNESDLNFFKRICSVEGIAYYFFHEDGAHQLRIIDKAEQLPTLTPKKVWLKSQGSEEDHLIYWQGFGQFATGSYEQRTYNYKTPTKLVINNAKAKNEAAKTPGSLDVESYIYADTHHNEDDGKAQTEAHANRGVERAHVYNGGGNCRNLLLGHHFELELAPGKKGDFTDKGKEFTLTKVSIAASEKSSVVSCKIEAVAKNELIYPSAQTPVMSGLQTALVTGPKGEEVHTDELGRIKVQFHWDREGKQDENTTCWLRVMQSFAGPSFGAHFTPRIGQEVVVAFDNGNPDRPFVIGTLYHPEHKPPYNDNKGTRSGIRTRSTKGGGADNCNELYFEDKKGSEEVYLQAEKDHNVWVKNDQAIKIDNDKAQTVAKNETNKVGENYTIKVGKKLLIDAESEIKLQVGGSTITITSSKIDISSSVVDVNGLIKLN